MHSLQVITHLRHLAVLLLCAALGVGQAVAGCGMMCLGAGGPAAGGGGGLSYSFAGSTSSTATGANVSASINVGTAAANRIIVVAGTTQAAGATATSVTVNSVLCTLDANASTVAIASCPGASFGSGSQTVAFNWSAGSFNGRGFSVWVVTGAASSTVVAQNSGTTASISLAVTAGDLMFGVVRYSGSAGPATWSASTQSPANTQLVLTNVISTADWTIASTNASFSASPNITQAAEAVATYH